MRKTRIMICGASGFIGRNLFEYFYNQPDRYETCGTYFRRKPDDDKKLLFQIDLRDRTEAIRATSDIDIVINCAAMTDGSGAVSANPGSYISDNIRINNNLIEAAHLNKVKHFIFLSCTVMYPSSDRPLTELEYDLDNLHPRYRMGARMKVFFEDLCRFYSDLGQTKYTAVRHTNIYGPYDKFDIVRGHVLSATIEKVMTTDKEIVVWGSGEETRDFLYIQDLIDFIERAVSIQSYKFKIFNVGYGRTYSINKLIEKIIFCSGKKIDVVHDLNKPSIKTEMNIDVGYAWKSLGWKAQIDLTEGIAMTLDWYRKNKSR